VDPESRRVLAPLLLAVFMRALPLTMFGPLLPAIARSLGAGLAEIGWIVSTYATGSLIAQPLMGRLSDRRGRRTVMLWCIALFAGGSLICALSTSLWLLVAGRLVQALGAGGIQPVASAIIGDRLPESARGGALGAIYGMFGLGTMAGALLGGALVDGALALAAHATLWTPLRAELASFPWHVVFWVNVVLACIALAAASSLPQDRSAPNAARTGFDVFGIFLMTGFAVCLMAAATTQGAVAITNAGGAALCLIWLGWWEQRASAPLFDPILFRDRGSTLIYIVAFLFGIPAFSLTIYSATYFIAQFGASEVESGLALFVLAVLYVAGAIAGGQAVRRVGAVAPLVSGLCLAGVGLGLMALLVSPTAVVAAMAIGGLGLGLASAPPNALILSYVPADRTGAASGLAITAPAAVSAFLHYRNGTVGENMRAEFVLACAICGACAALAARLPRGKSA
jgi:MFS family permease